MDRVTEEPTDAENERCFKIAYQGTHIYLHWSQVGCLFLVVQIPLSMEAKRLEWAAIPSPGDLSDPGIKPRSPDWQVDSSPLIHLGSPSTDCGDFRLEENLD